MLHKEDLMKLISDHTEDEVRKMLCGWLDCATVLDCPKCPDCPDCPKTAETPAPAPLLTIHGIVSDDGMYFPVPLGLDGQEEVMMHLDTGAFEMLLTQAVADKLQLPNLGASDVAGVTGSSAAYNSEVTVDFGGDLVFNNVHCTVDPEFTGNSLFGFRFFIDHKIAVTVNPVTGEVIFTQG